MKQVETSVHLRARGVSVLIELPDGEPPRILHWGGDLGEFGENGIAFARRAVPHSRPATDVRPGLIAQEATGFLGHPTLTGSRNGLAWSPSFVVESVSESDDSVVFEMTDPLAQLRISSTLSIDRSGILAVSHRLTNEGTDPYSVGELALALPVPLAANEILDMGGRWSLERQPQRRPLETGTWLRELRHGRTGFDSPLVFAAGTPGFNNRSGTVWAVHFAWSGNSRLWAERTPEGDQSLAAAELLGPGGEILQPGESYETPTLFGAWSDRGVDGIGSRFHERLRSRPRHPRTARPVTFNTWEAVYFDQTPETLSHLAEVAARYGVERFVLDDGWFLGRRDDARGLGDWRVDREVWAEGLEPLVTTVRQLGMQFGIWVEPEMVNPDSGLFRAHPDWILHVPGRDEPLLWRNQYVLDLSRQDVFDYLIDALDDLLTDHPISYLKWDHNRDLLDAGKADGRHGVHATTLGVYRLMDELRLRHPTVEIESCSSGGARVDLAILERTDRVWGSDTNDALDRHLIQRWTSVLLPPELVGSHVGPPTAHITGRTHDLGFRASNAVFGSFGIEWDIARATPAETAGLDTAIAFFKRFRDLIHSGELVHGDLPNPSATLQGVVAKDGSEALYQFSQLTSPPIAVPGPLPFPGLRADFSYRVKGIELPAHAHPAQHVMPAWWDDQELTVSGQVLSTLGLALPGLGPEQAVFVHLTQVPPAGL